MILGERWGFDLFALFSQYVLAKWTSPAGASLLDLGSVYTLFCFVLRAFRFSCYRPLVLLQLDSYLLLYLSCNTVAIEAQNIREAIRCTCESATLATVTAASGVIRGIFGTPSDITTSARKTCPWKQ